jgi:hypothetical protein
MRNTAGVTGGNPISVLLQSISGVSAIPLVAFYDIHGGQREVLFFYFVPDTTRDYTIDLVLIDQSVGKRSLHLMDTVNAKKRWTTIYWRVKFLKESHIVNRFAKTRVYFLKINKTYDNSFFETSDCRLCCSIA